MSRISNLTHQAKQRGAAVNRANAMKKLRAAAAYASVIRLTEAASYQTIADTLNGMGFRTAQRKQFAAMTVKRMLDRMGIE